MNYKELYAEFFLPGKEYAQMIRPNWIGRMAVVFIPWMILHIIQTSLYVFAATFGFVANAIEQVTWPIQCWIARGPFVMWDGDDVR